MPPLRPLHSLRARVGTMRRQLSSPTSPAGISPPLQHAYIPKFAPVCLKHSSSFVFDQLRIHKLHNIHVFLLLLGEYGAHACEDGRCPKIRMMIFYSFSDWCRPESTWRVL